jgi:hypothetical protein
MHFDDRLDTVLRLTASGPAMARIQFRQLVDLLGRATDQSGSADARSAAFARLNALATVTPPAERAAILRESGARLTNPELVAYLATDEPEVASAAITAADLSPAQWLALIPTLPVRARGILRHRQGYGPEVEALLERLGIGDRGLPPAEVVAERPQRPELVVVEGGAATGSSRRARREEPSTAGIGAIVRRIEAFRRTRTNPDEAEPGESARAPLEAAGTLPLAAALDFTTDAEGCIDWADGSMAPALVGIVLASTRQADEEAPLGLAMRHRQPLRDVSLVLAGAPALAGHWRLDAVPRFTGPDRRFLGYAGRLRRPYRQDFADGASDTNAADSMREVLHELRTPANAIQVAAEIIQQQLYGPAPHEYRALAAAIAGDTAQILAGFEELDRLVRLESGALGMSSGECDLGALVLETVARLRAWTHPRGSGFTVPDTKPQLTAALEREEAARLVWRLLAALAGVSATGECLDLSFASQGGRVILSIDMPATLAERLEEAVKADQRVELVRSLSAGIFGIGFTLRLATAEAAAAGGALLRDGTRLHLALPGLTPAAAGHTQA